MSDPSPVLADLRVEGQALDALVGPLAADRWATPTPAAGWTIAHQIAHLAWTDQQALRAATDPDGFRRAAEAALASPDTFVDEGAEEGARRPPAELLAHWRAGREALHDALAAYTGGRLPWFGPPMSITSMATARLMETWAHGQDVADALGAVREPTARLRHVAHIGVRARNFAFLAHGLTPPEEEFRVELRAPGPDGGVWTYGPEDAAQRVSGDALGFCLLVTQRAHRDDVDVRAEGAEAERWLGIAQAFAGPPGPGRSPRPAAAPKGPTA
ncbi:TIGR03084 family metal-binding protein [Streptomyces ochraceiscleroticus]|uniref:TIGR03084 family metal-binding protein n=1 Tax=Streptomyces ochraceiscleroticus TaxID=47761 RepID=A0ABW1MG52_9ACTN|nr:TIGR03084 family metal-binding protein [Streptomyces ochraceiscleroticus]